MTEPEAQALATRLERIWQPQSPVTMENGKNDFAFALPLDSNTLLDVWTYERYEERVFWLSDTVFEMGFLACQWPCGELDFAWLGDGHAEYLFTRQQQWLQLFRRGCWLSGADIEASAHEKAEWMRGFTREEIEAWNLAF